MSLDRLALQATAELLEHTSPDPTALLTDLKRTRRRRTAGRAVGLVAAFALVVGGWVVVRGDDASPRPAEPVGPAVRNGAIVSRLDSPSHSPYLSVVDGELAFMPDNAALFSQVAFTWDGSELVYTVADDITAIDVRTGATRVLAQCPIEYCNVALSPDGRQLAVSDGEALKILTVGSDEAREVPLPGVGYPGSPQWSPDGRSIAFVSLDGVQVVSADGTGLRLLHRLDGAISHGTSWSPDGSRIAFLEGVPVGGPPDGPAGSPEARFIRERSYTLTTIRTDGSDLRRLLPAGRCMCLHDAPPAAAWSPDGTRIALAAIGGDPAAPLGVYVMRPDGSDVRQLSFLPYGSTLAWQPLPH